MLVAVALALLATAGGTVVSYAYDDDAPLPVRLAYGAASGLVAFSGLGLLLANVIAIGPAALGAGLLVGIPVVALAHPAIRTHATADLRSLGSQLSAASADPAWVPPVASCTRSWPPSSCGRCSTG